MHSGGQTNNPTPITSRIIPAAEAEAQPFPMARNGKLASGAKSSRGPILNVAAPLASFSQSFQNTRHGLSDTDRFSAPEVTSVHSPSSSSEV
jgi:hypothetical protein